jgi:hypothetical protein
MSGVYMNRADGYWPTMVSGGYDQYGIYVGTSSGTDFTKQWLFHRVVVGWYDAYGRLNWTYGNWIARQNALGDHTDGISTWFQREGRLLGADGLFAGCDGP